MELKRNEMNKMCRTLFLDYAKDTAAGLENMLPEERPLEKDDQIIYDTANLISDLLKSLEKDTPFSVDMQKINDLGAQINDLALRAPFLPEDIATLDRAGLILWYIKYAAEADK